MWWMWPLGSTGPDRTRIHRITKEGTPPLRGVQEGIMNYAIEFRVLALTGDSSPAVAQEKLTTALKAAGIKAVIEFTDTVYAAVSDGDPNS